MQCFLLVMVKSFVENPHGVVLPCSTETRAQIKVSVFIQHSLVGLSLRLLCNFGK